MKKVAEHIIGTALLTTGIQSYCTFAPSSSLPFSKFSGLGACFAIRVKRPFTAVISTVPSTSIVYNSENKSRDISSMIKHHDILTFNTGHNCHSCRTTEDVNYCGLASKTNNIFKHKNIPKTQSNKHLELTYK